MLNAIVREDLHKTCYLMLLKKATCSMFLFLLTEF